MNDEFRLKTAIALQLEVPPPSGDSARVGPAAGRAGDAESASTAVRLPALRARSGRPVNPHAIPTNLVSPGMLLTLLWLLTTNMIGLAFLIKIAGVSSDPLDVLADEDNPG